jgi:type II secretory pathway component PulC
MTRWLLVFAMICVMSAPRTARADDPLYSCKEAAPTTKLTASFKPDIPLADLATWIMGFTCKNIIFASDVPKHATRVNILAPRTMTPKQAFQLFVDAIEATGLVVTVKADTVIIKLGPGMPKSCPDASASAPVPPVTPVTPPATGPSPDDIAQAEIDAGIRKINDVTFEIRTALLDKILLNPMSVAKGARVVPSMKNGKADGFKLYAIRPNSVYAKLGLENGDTLNAINGFALDSADKALEVYTKLRTATRLEVDITRRGKPVTLTYTIK